MAAATRSEEANLRLETDPRRTRKAPEGDFRSDFQNTRAEGWPLGRDARRDRDGG